MTADRPPLLLMTRGIPGSGKSYWAMLMAALFPEIATVSMDELRTMIDRGQFRGHATEGLVQDVQDFLVTEAIEAGRDVIVHNTHVKAKIPNRLRRLTAGLCEVAMVDFADVPYETCISRDFERGPGRPMVGTAVIDGMVKGLKGGAAGFRDWLMLTPVEAQALLADGRPAPVTLPQYEPDTSLPLACIVDLDGTLAKHQGRNPYDAERCDEDLFDTVVWTAARSFNHVVFLSGREDKWREKTVRWLGDHIVGLDDVHLFMRATGDMRPDSIVKRELFLQHVTPHFNVAVSFDDRDSVVQMWRRIGLPCFQVAPGRF